MEVHVVHYNSKYGSFTEAQNHKDGLSVIAILFDILPQRNSDVSLHNKCFSVLELNKPHLLAKW